MSSNNTKSDPTARNRALWQNDDCAPGGELEILEVVHLRALCEDKDIRNALKATELQELIRSVDGSRCRLEALAAAQHNVPQFKEFCDMLLARIYAVEDARHRYNY